MTDPIHDSTIQAAASLERSMDSLGNQIHALTKYGRQSRRLIWSLAASLLLDLVLSVIVWVVAVQANHASDLAAEATSVANQNHQAQVTTCVASNEARAATVQLWNYVLDLSTKNELGADKHKQIDDFRVYVNTTFAQRDCNTASGG